MPGARRLGLSSSVQILMELAPLAAAHGIEALSAPAALFEDDRAAREAAFGTDLAEDAKIRKRQGGRVWEIELPEYRTFSMIQLQEDISLGQRISSFEVQIQNFDVALASGGWWTIAEGTTIGYKRIIPVEPRKARKLRVVVTGSHARPVLSGISLF